MKKKVRRRKAAKAKAAKPEAEFRRAVLRESRKAESLLELELGDLYSILGAQVQAAQMASKLARVKVPRGADKRRVYLQSLSLLPELPLKSGEEFLKRYWRRVLNNACKWWGANKEKFSGRALVANLALAIAPALPLQWRAASILTIVAAILMRSELDTLCETRPELPPGLEKEKVEEERIEEEREEIEEAPEEVKEEERFPSWEEKAETSAEPSLEERASF